jgi:predicted RNA-binding protein with PUA-like domain
MFPLSPEPERVERGMAQWLMKTEPGDYSWDRLLADGRTEWTGVRNHQAAGNMRQMKKGERVFFYRSVVDPAIVGTMRVSKEAYPDPADGDGRWVLVELVPDVAAAREVTLKNIKDDPRLGDLALVRQSRLSVMPISDDHWRILCEMAGIAP